MPLRLLWWVQRWYCRKQDGKKIRVIGRQLWHLSLIHIFRRIAVSLYQQSRDLDTAKQAVIQIAPQLRVDHVCPRLRCV